MSDMGFLYDIVEKEEWMKSLIKPSIKNVDDIDWNKYPHFKPDYEKGRFYCHCNENHPAYIDEDLLQILEDARQKAGIPFIIESAFRCPKHNIQVGGRPLSVHQVGRAVDIRARNGRWRYPMIKAFMKHTDIYRMGVAKSFIHVDTVKPNESLHHGAPSIWVY